MASLFTLHYPPSLFSSHRTLLHSPKRRRFRAHISVNAASKTGAAVVWLKHDLRVDDHPALLAAADHSGAIPLYVFDHRILSRFEDERLEMVVVALEDLRKCLRDKGTNLMVRFGNAENVIQEIVEKVRSVSAVYAEEEVEYGLREMVGAVKDRLGAMQPSAPEFVLWRTPFYDVKSLKDIPDSYKDFTKLRLPIKMPLPPATFSGSAVELDWGPMPTFGDLKKFVDANPCKMQERWTSIKVQSKIRDEVFVTTKGKSMGGQTSTVLNSLGAYLRYLDGESRDDFWQKVHERMPYAESRDGASFNTLFGTALSLGILSRRRVYFEAIKHNKERNRGFLSPFGSGATISAAVDSVCSMEWYWLVALKSQMSDNRKHHIRIWRWKGYLIQYTVVGHEGPAILLVHGFGAFLEHYRDNIDCIAEGGNRVWAITILGFGKSEKPNVVYTELLWSEMLRDFILEVVGEPVHLVGNSIGGYIIAIVACLWPALANSVVLINSGGEIIPYFSAPFTKERRTSGTSWLGARFLLFYLRFQLKDIVQKCYPNKTERADNWLIDEMLRASYDPGVAVVLESVFSFNLSLPLNYLLKEFKEKVLIIQGMRDPISNSKSKVAMIKEHCDGFLIKELDAGHCPHDELPEEVNSVICEWVVTLSSRRPVGSLSRNLM
ncbi:uncharacterized protein LOC126803813 [Argentina anserina]|uniref:uncharacterized protein LOC126803813 n=1 Tax=Argentina anserina TaxID=57926 RepID=UPI0021767520|nr:uncharacterized protein LOC126803813 [Potentilla anserina]